MKYYIAGRYSRRLELLGYAKDLEERGHEIVSTWLSGKHESNSKHGARADQEADQDERAGWAREDLEDLARADAIIVFTNEPNGEGRERGGYHVELGFVLGWNFACDPADAKEVILVGSRVNVFHCLPCLEHFPTWGECLAALSDEAVSPKIRCRPIEDGGVVPKETNGSVAV